MNFGSFIIGQIQSPFLGKGKVNKEHFDISMLEILLKERGYKLSKPKDLTANNVRDVEKGDTCLISIGWVIKTQNSGYDPGPLESLMKREKEGRNIIFFEIEKKEELYEARYAKCTEECFEKAKETSNKNITVHQISKKESEKNYTENVNYRDMSLWMAKEITKN